MADRLFVERSDEPHNIKNRSVEVPAWIKANDSEAYAIVLNDDSVNRVFPEGCIVAVSPRSEPQNGSIAVVSIDNNDPILRRLYRTRQTLVLSPDSYSSEYRDIVVTEKGDHDVEFGGKVIWLQSYGEIS